MQLNDECGWIYPVHLSVCMPAVAKANADLKDFYETLDVYEWNIT